MLEIGSLVDGKYKILNKIGQGGMSVVYLAMNEKANKQWAIKEVRRDGVSDYEAVRQGLVAETDILKKLNHPNLPSIIDVIQDRDSFLIVMDYIEGKPLSYILKHQGAQSQENVIEWSKQLCDVLGYLHSREKPIIYRDMKPSNVMLKPDGTVTLIDFGTAREYKAQSIADTSVLGTRGYAAPEQYGGRGQTDARTDIYCLGATMYHLITGHNPATPPYEMYPITQWNPKLSTGLEQIIIKCTQQNPEDRYQNCAELMYALEHYQDFENETKKEYTKKWRMFIGTASFCLISAIGTTAFGIAKNSKIQSTYDYCVQEGDRKVAGKNYDEAIQSYKNAIEIAPEKGEAYLHLIEEAILGDETFSTEESTILKEVIDSTDSKGQKYQDILKDKNLTSYGKLMYDLGNAYYFYYETKDVGRAKAGEYYKNAEETAKGLDANQLKRAKILSSICGYIDNVGIVSKDGISETSYIQLWGDLKELVETDFGTDYSLAIKAYYTFDSMLSEPVKKYEEKFVDSNISYSDIKKELEYTLGKLQEIQQRYEEEKGILNEVSATDLKTAITNITTHINTINNIIKQGNTRTTKQSVQNEESDTTSSSSKKKKSNDTTIED